MRKTLQTLFVLGVSSATAAVEGYAQRAAEPGAPPQVSPSLFAPLYVRPAVPTDAANYAKVTECLAIIRLNEKEEYRDGLPERKDTLPPAAFRVRDTLPTAITTAVRRCAAKFTAASLMRNGGFGFGEISNTIRVLLAAGRDQEAADLIRQWIAAVPPSPYRDSVVTQIATEAASVALQARPRRLALAEAMVDVIPDWKRFFVSKVNILGSVFQQARVLGADSVIKRTTALYLRMPALLRDSVFKGDSSFIATATYQGVARSVYGLYLTEHRAEVLDSMAVSDAAYQRLVDTALKMALVRKGWDRRFDATTFDWSTASRVDTLKDVARTYPAGASARPSRGKVALVVRLDETRTCREYCAAMAATLRRVQQRFSEVEITVVEGHRGYFELRTPSLPGAEPEAEAALMDSLFLKKHRIPATLVVFKYPFVRLPDPDARWIKMRSPNDDKFENAGYYVITNEGRAIEFVHLVGADPFAGKNSGEQTIMETLQVLRARMAKR